MIFLLLLLTIDWAVQRRTSSANSRCSSLNRLDSGDSVLNSSGITGTGPRVSLGWGIWNPEARARSALVSLCTTERVRRKQRRPGRMGSVPMRVVCHRDGVDDGDLSLPRKVVGAVLLLSLSSPSLPDDQAVGDNVTL